MNVSDDLISVLDTVFLISISLFLFVAILVIVIHGVFMVLEQIRDYRKGGK